MANFCSISGQIENSGGRESSLGGGAERSISVSIHRPLVCSRPDIVARQIDVLPTKGRQMSEKVVGNFFGHAQGGDGAVQITGVPQDDRGDEEVQAGGAMLLIFVGAVADFPETMKEDGARQAVARLALVEFTARIAAQLRVFDPIERKQGALQSAQLA